MSGRKIEIGLSDEEHDFLRDEVSSGRFADEEAVLRAGLANLAWIRKLEGLRALIDEGLADIKRSDGISLDMPGDLARYIVENVENPK